MTCEKIIIIKPEIKRREKLLLDSNAILIRRQNKRAKRINKNATPANPLLSDKVAKINSLCCSGKNLKSCLRT